MTDTVEFDDSSVTKASRGWSAFLVGTLFVKTFVILMLTELRAAMMEQLSQLAGVLNVLKLDSEMDATN